jgi:hypothetical protein
MHVIIRLGGAIMLTAALMCAIALYAAAPAPGTFDVVFRN